jgi:cation/acetate symporter
MLREWRRAPDGAERRAGPPSVGLGVVAIVSIPAGFLCCWLGTLLAREPVDATAYHELHVRAETGLGAIR